MSIGRGKEITAIVSRGIFLLLASLIFFVDQLTKQIAQNSLTLGRSHPVFPNIFHLTLIENEGIAFGLFQDFGKVLFFVITLSIIALIVLGFRSDPFRFKTQIGMGLVLGGALGNWMDRIRAGAVIDFLDFRFWPVFNLADVAISVGVGIFLLGFLGKEHVS